MNTPDPIDYADAPRSTARDAQVATDPLIGSAELRKLIGRAVTVNCTPPAAYECWRNLSQLHRFMAGMKEVTVLDDRHAQVAIGDEEGVKAQWELEIVEEHAPHLIAWRALEGKEIVHEGKVEFALALGGRGTVVTATLALKGPRSRVGEWWARLFHHDPKIQADRVLRRYKQWVETGEISTSEPPAAAPRAS